MPKGARVSGELPGPNGRKIIERDKTSTVTITKADPIVAERASGSIIEDVDGNKIIEENIKSATSEAGK